MEYTNVVNVTEVLYFDCPACNTESYAPSWVSMGDKVACKTCGCVVAIGEHYADCRPSKIQEPIKSI